MKKKLQQRCMQEVMIHSKYSSMFIQSGFFVCMNSRTSSDLPEQYHRSLHYSRHWKSSGGRLRKRWSVVWTLMVRQQLHEYIAILNHRVCQLHRVDLGLHRSNRIENRGRTQNAHLWRHVNIRRVAGCGFQGIVRGWRI